MSQKWDENRRTTLLGDLGPLPEAVECDNDETWRMFLELSQPSAYTDAHPPARSPREDEDQPAEADITIEQVMAEARRYNRICPIAPQWRQLHAMLLTAGVASEPPPPPIEGADLARTPPLGKRMRLRDQVTWAAERGHLRAVFRFLRDLPEDQWHHIGR